MIYTWRIFCHSSACDDNYEDNFSASVEDAEKYFRTRFGEFSRKKDGDLCAEEKDGNDVWHYRLECIGEEF